MPNITPVTLSHNGATFELIPYGLTLRRLTYAGKDVLVGPEDAQELPGLGHHYRNTVIGRYANRLPSGTHSVGSVDFTPEAQNDEVALHGGPNGYDTRDWAQISRSQSSLFTETSGPFAPAASEAIFALDSPHGDQGYPGAIRIEALYQLKDSTKGAAGLVELFIAFRAKLQDGSVTATPINLTQHTGYVLNDSGDEHENLNDHLLWIKTSSRTQLDPKSACATGATEAVPFDFKTPKGQDLGYVINNGSVDDNIILEPHTDDEVVARLSHKKWPYQLSFYTNQSSVMSYAGNFFDESGTRKALHQRKSDPQAGYPKHGAIFLEFHHPVATVLHQKLQDVAGTNTLLKAGDTVTAWHSTVIEKQ